VVYVVVKLFSCDGEMILGSGGALLGKGGAIPAKAADGHDRAWLDFVFSPKPADASLRASAGSTRAAQPEIRITAAPRAG